MASLTLRSQQGRGSGRGSNKSSGSTSKKYQPADTTATYAFQSTQSNLSSKSGTGVAPSYAGNFSTIVNIVKNVVGAGLVSMPLTLYDGTPAVAYTWLLIIGVLNCFAFWVVAVISEGACNTYGQLWERTIGKKTRLLMDIFLLVNGIITCMQYLIVISDFVPKAIPQVFGDGGCLGAVHAEKGSLAGGATERLYTVLFAGYGIILPIALFSKLDFLKWPSFIGVAFTMFAVMYVVYDYATRGYYSAQVPRKDPATGAFDVYNDGAWTDQKNDGRGNFDFLMMMSIMSIYSSTYACHYNAPRFYRELGPSRSPGRFAMITITSFVLILGIFVMFVICGYGRFGGSIQGNVFLGYQNVPASEKDEVAIKIAWMGMALSVMTSYPLLSNSARAALYEIFFPYTADKSPTWIYVLVTVLFVTLSVVMGWLGPDVALLGQIKGATTTVSLCSIFPGLMLLFKVFQDEKAVEDGPAAADGDNEPLLQDEVLLTQGSQFASDYLDTDLPQEDPSEKLKSSSEDEANLTRVNMVKGKGATFKTLAWVLIIISSLMAVVGITTVFLKQADVIGRAKPLEATLPNKWKNVDYDLSADDPDGKAFLTKLLEDGYSSTSSYWRNACAWKTAPAGSGQEKSYQLLINYNPASPIAIRYDELCQ
ncbi:unnamed protein product [Amoebophrya sp. A120]|nr:unnamed protein product [Amoebophrya sp. A120]|eukprot:GSA120T00018540001.1